MRIAALGAALAGLGLLVMIFVAGSIARANRKVLLTLLGPGIYFTAVVITGLIVVHAAIAVILLARVYLGASVMVGLGALAGIAAVARNAFSLVKKAEATAIGKPVSRAEAPDLWVTIAETAQVLSSLRPDHVVVGLDPTFYVTEANVTTLRARSKGVRYSPGGAATSGRLRAVARTAATVGENGLDLTAGRMLGYGDCIRRGHPRARRDGSGGGGSIGVAQGRCRSMSPGRQETTRRCVGRSGRRRPRHTPPDASRSVRGRRPTSDVWAHGS